MNRLYEWDLNLCVRFNRFSTIRTVERLFALISRLGNGVFWYSLMCILPLVYGARGWQASIHMLLAAIPALAIYKVLKKKTSRPRPCKVHPHVRQKTATLDQFSFPSGHTLHAVNFTIIADSYFPELGGILSGFTALVALSRPILGLHYPSDVLAGAAIGTLVALCMLQPPLLN